jgi:hypothetical protein
VILVVSPRHPLNSTSVNDSNRERLDQKWIEMVNEAARVELEAFLQPRLTDGAPLSGKGLKPLERWTAPESGLYAFRIRRGDEGTSEKGRSK